MHSLPLFAVLDGRPVVLLGEGAAADAKRRLLERAGAVVAGEDATTALAIVAIEDEAQARAAVARLKARGILVNAVDRPDLCDFTLPAIVERGSVLVAIGTGGASAGLAAALRQRLEALLPPELGELADALRRARAMLRARFPEAAERRRAIATLLAERGALDPLVEHDEPEAVLERHLPAPGADFHRDDEEGVVERVRITSPDPDDLTLRAARLLAQADRVHHPADMRGPILDRARADALRIAGAAPSPAPPGLTVELVWA